MVVLVRCCEVMYLGADVFLFMRFHTNVLDDSQQYTFHQLHFAARGPDLCHQGNAEDYTRPESKLYIQSVCIITTHFYQWLRPSHQSCRHALRRAFRLSRLYRVSHSPHRVHQLLPVAHDRVVIVIAVIVYRVVLVFTQISTQYKSVCRGLHAPRSM